MKTSGVKTGAKEGWNSAVRKPPPGSRFNTIQQEARCASEKKNRLNRTSNRDKSLDDSDELATFLALESETQKEVLKEEAFDVEDIALDGKDEHPYFIQNLLNVMNNRKVDQSSDMQSWERSLNKRNPLDTTVVADYSNTSKRPGMLSKLYWISLDLLSRGKNARLEKSPVMKYLSISLVKENTSNSTTRKPSSSSISLAQRNRGKPKE